MANRVRNKNESVFYDIDDIHFCIAHDLKVTFQYFTYNLQKKKEYLKKGERYIVSPYALLWNDDNYYLLAFEAGKMKHFRVDKMDNIKRSDEKREGKDAFKALKLTDRSIKVFSMFGGDEENITLRFSNHLIGVVLDRFGKDITIMPDGQKHFKIHINVEVSPQFFAWLCGFGRAVKILSPASVADKMHEHVEKIAKMYEVDTEL